MGHHCLLHSHPSGTLYLVTVIYTSNINTISSVYKYRKKCYVLFNVFKQRILIERGKENNLNSTLILTVSILSGL